MKVEIHPLNAKGKYYIDPDNCICCAACEGVEPNIFNNDNDEYVYRVARQPENSAEESLCEEALTSCPTEAIHDDGN
jgi:ferredoxin